jgi:hypothetical protein
MARLNSIVTALVVGCATGGGSAQHSATPEDGQLDRLISALDTMPGALESISEGNAQMLQFTYVPEIVDPLVAANERAVPKLVGCLNRSQPSKVKGPERGFVPVGVVCAQVLSSTAFFQDRLSSGDWPVEFRDSIEVGYSPTAAELERAQRAWKVYLRAEAPE